MTIAVEERARPMARDEGDRRRQRRRASAAADQQRAADHHLRDAEAEDVAAQRPQPRRLQLQPDDEQEHDDAELGDAEDRLPDRGRGRSPNGPMTTPAAR